MKKKFGLWLNIVTICLCVCAIAIGVYAATTASVTVSGQIGFNAHNCKVNASGYVYGHAKDDTLMSYYTGTGEDKVGVNFGTKESPVLTKTIEGAATANLGALKFTDLADATNIPDIVIEFTFANQSAYQISAKVELLQEINNLGCTITYTKSAETGGGYCSEI